MQRFFGQVVGAREHDGMGWWLMRVLREMECRCGRNKDKLCLRLSHFYSAHPLNLSVTQLSAEVLLVKFFATIGSMSRSVAKDWISCAIDRILIKQCMKWIEWIEMVVCVVLSFGGNIHYIHV